MTIEQRITLYWEKGIEKYLEATNRKADPAQKAALQDLFEAAKNLEEGRQDQLARFLIETKHLGEAIRACRTYLGLAAMPPRKAYSRAAKVQGKKKT